MRADKALYSLVDLIVRRPVVAKIGGFRPEEGLRSWFGGRFWMPPGVDWPSEDGSPLHPLLQVVTSELPALPDFLDGIGVLQVFIGDELPVDAAPNGRGFRVITHAQADGFAPIKPPAGAEFTRPFQIKWTAGKEEGPCWEEVWEHADAAALQRFVDEVPDCFERYGERYARHDGTKLGGWASYIQGVADLPGRYVFQIASEEKPQFIVGDNGNLYFYLDQSREWWMQWDCY